MAGPGGTVADGLTASPARTRSQKPRNVCQFWFLADPEQENHMSDESTARTAAKLVSDFFVDQAATPDELETLQRRFLDLEVGVLITAENGGRIEVVGVDREHGFLIFDTVVAEIPPEDHR